jgi:hypothetical protein
MFFAQFLFKFLRKKNGEIRNCKTHCPQKKQQHCFAKYYLCMHFTWKQKKSVHNNRHMFSDI